MYPIVEINTTSVTVTVDDKGSKFIICKDPDGSLAVCVCGSNGVPIRLPLPQDKAEIIANRLIALVD
ncbi:MAG: hypothetical protein HMLIMOIP_002712 [Candidatus Nitrosomirales archaeon]|jgi:hypothetical protein